MRITSAGNVGIGTTSPSHQLHVSSSGGTSIAIDGSATGDPYLSWKQANTQRAYIQWINSGTYLDINNAIVIKSGNVGIGTASPDSIKLDVEDDIEIGTGTTGCVRDADNTTLVGTCVSDERLKKSIAGLSAGTLDKLVQLRPVTFEWRNDEFPWLNGQVGTNYGLIAQEVEAVFPEMIHTDDKGTSVSHTTSVSPCAS